MVLQFLAPVIGKVSYLSPSLRQGLCLKCRKSAGGECGWGVDAGGIPLARKARYCTGTYVRQAGMGAAAGFTAPSEGATALPSLRVALSWAACSDTVSSHQAGTQHLWAQKIYHCASPCSGAQRQRAHTPGAEHKAHEKDLGMTLGCLIFNNLFTRVCKPGTV